MEFKSDPFHRVPPLQGSDQASHMTLSRRGTRATRNLLRDHVRVALEFWARVLSAPRTSGFINVPRYIEREGCVHPGRPATLFILKAGHPADTYRAFTPYLPAEGWHVKNIT